VKFIIYVNLLRDNLDQEFIQFFVLDIHRFVLIFDVSLRQESSSFLVFEEHLVHASAFEALNAFK
jgi:hypothetical protein